MVKGFSNKGADSQLKLLAVSSVQESESSQDKTDLLMAFSFDEREFGVQYHPESIETQYGAQTFQNFLELCSTKWLERNISPFPAVSDKFVKPLSEILMSSPSLNLQVKIESVAQSQLNGFDVESFFRSTILSGHEGVNSRNPAFWLDSATAGSPGDSSRFSYMGGGRLRQLREEWFQKGGNGHAGVNDFSLAYNVSSKVLERRFYNGDAAIEERLVEGRTFFDVLESEREQYTAIVSPAQMEVCGFLGGLVGYLGYELGKESLEGYAEEKLRMGVCAQAKAAKEGVSPDAYFYFAGQALCYDHVRGALHLVQVIETTAALASENPATCPEDSFLLFLLRKFNDDLKEETGPSFELSDRGRTQEKFLVDAPEYLDKVQQCIELMRKGESYELCLTNRYQMTFSLLKESCGNIPFEFALYCVLRRRNPAPFGCYLELPTPGLAILSSSPEKLCSIDPESNVECKPIKGTTARGSDPAHDEAVKASLLASSKNRAELLMIVDLTRNDLAKVCTAESVRCAEIVKVETFATVHQLVSSIRGKSIVSPVAVIKELFPPGSMTGAPKLASVLLLERLEEQEPRGVFSGCLGYFSLSGDTAFSVVIRTALIACGTLDAKNDNTDVPVCITLNGGGAITVLSDPQDELDEVHLKLRATRDAVAESLGGPPVRDLGKHALDNTLPKVIFTTIGPFRASSLPPYPLPSNIGAHFSRLRSGCFAYLGRELPLEIATVEDFALYLRDERAQAVTKDVDGATWVRHRIAITTSEEARNLIVDRSAFELCNFVPGGAQSLAELPPWDPGRKDRMRVLLSSKSRNTETFECQYKTTLRRTYDDACREMDAWNSKASTGQRADDVLLVNLRGEVTETTIANVAVEVQDVPGGSFSWVTPAIRSGLLAGTKRGEVLMECDDSGTPFCRPCLVTRTMLMQARRVIIFNAVRGVREVEIVGIDGDSYD
jgi:para-aminobenzoate synthetase